MAKTTEEAAAPPPVRQISPPVPQTSLAARGVNVGEVTVQFKRWHAHGNTAYQKGQYAGFPIGVALEMEKAGVVMLDPAFVRHGATDHMIRK